MKGHQLLEPYLMVSVDEVHVGQTSASGGPPNPCAPRSSALMPLKAAIIHEMPLGYDHFMST
ncbi:hypothetical protein P7K49_018227, partial [Saguinus oedipus]